MPTRLWRQQYLCYLLTTVGTERQWCLAFQDDMTERLNDRVLVTAAQVVILTLRCWQSRSPSRQTALQHPVNKTCISATLPHSQCFHVYDHWLHWLLQSCLSKNAGDATCSFNSWSATDTKNWSLQSTTVSY